MSETKTLKQENDRPIIRYADKCECGGTIKMREVDFPGNYELVCEHCSFEIVPHDR